MGKIVGRIPGEGKKEYHCFICEEQHKDPIWYYKDNPGFATHITRVHKISYKDFYDKYIKKENEGRCKICSKPTKWRSNRYLEHCSTKCVNLNPTVRQKIKKTYFDKTGYEHNMHNPESKNKFKQTNLKIYGTEHPVQSKQVQDKIKNTNLERYGVEHTFQVEEFQDKGKETMIENYGVDNLFKSKEFQEQAQKKTHQYKREFFEKMLPKNYELLEYEVGSTAKIKCDKGHEFECNKQLIRKRKKAGYTCCIICQPLNDFRHTTSVAEKEVRDFIKQYYSEPPVLNDKTILNNKQEIDMYYPDVNLAFEFNGLYWHCELYKDKNYHLNKTEQCLEKGIHLIHIYEDDWKYKKDIVKSRILNLFGKTKNVIYARQCNILEVSSKDSNDFLENNHIQGLVNSKTNLGLYYNNELVSLMTFGSSRFEKDKIELYRFCNKLDYNVVGGASKLFKHFLNHYEYDEIVSYADRSWSKGNLYEKLGFKLIGKSAPNYYYNVNGIRENRFKFRKSQLIKEGYPSDKTEHEIMQDRDIYRIYDSGSLKFEYKK